MRKTKIESMKTRQHLLLAALEVFYRQGVTRSTLQEIAQEAGVTRGALYWHFKNKEELFEELFEYTFQHIFPEQDNQQTIENAWDYLRNQLITTLRHIAEDEIHRKFCNVLHMKCERTPYNETITALTEKYHGMFLTRITEMVKLCHQQGKLPKNIDIEFATLYLESNFVGLMKLWVFQSQRFDLVQCAERSIDATFATLQNSPLLLKS